MGSYIINGQKKLNGEVVAQSSKNALLPLICACILIDDEVVFENCPKINDVLILLEILKTLGAKYYFNNYDLHINCSSMYSYEISKELAVKIRASIFLAGPLISRFHKAIISYPGGCDIGKRPIDMHVQGLKALGVECSENDVMFLKCDKIVGTKIRLRCKSVGTTINLILASLFCEGETILENVAKEPEIVCLCNFLKCHGAKIYGEGSSQIKIVGVKKLSKSQNKFKPISDRIEVGTFILACMSTGGEIIINNANFKHNLALLKKIFNNACKIGMFNDKIYVKSIGFGSSLKNIKCLPFPSFPTDLQTPLCAYATTLLGTTVIEECVFENRFKQLDELIKMGANITVSNNKAIIKGVDYLKGTTVKALDLRGGAGMVIAGLKAEGTTTINDIEIISRGYVDLDKKLNSLGADIKRI